MSATNRGSVRNKEDYYITPQHTIEEFLAAFAKVEPRLLEPHRLFLDPCCGGDEYNAAAYPTAIRKFCNSPIVATHDIRADSEAQRIGDYLADSLNVYPDFILSNPPYNKAVEFIEKALSEVRHGDYVAFLLRLNFLGSQKRKSFFERTLPKYIFTHSRRPKFMKSGSDATEYAHFVWQKGWNDKFSKTIVI
jgi:hypothetical protein